MSTTLERPSDAATFNAASDGLSTSCAGADFGKDTDAITLGALPLGARLILRCRKDWRTAAVAAFEIELGRAVLSVASPSGHTYRVRRPLDSPLSFEGSIPVLGERSNCWRAGLARYDVRW